MALIAFFWTVALAALSFWVLSLVWPNGPAGLILALGAGAGAVFVTLHVPAAITGLLLWQWRRPVMPPRRRVLHETATLYFGSAVAVGMAGNFAAMLAVDRVL
jgi:hypothetical protein